MCQGGALVLEATGPQPLRAGWAMRENGPAARNDSVITIQSVMLVTLGVLSRARLPRYGAGLQARVARLTAAAIKRAMP